MTPLTALGLEHQLDDHLGLVSTIADYDRLCVLESDGLIKQLSPQDSGICRFVPTATAPPSLHHVFG